MKRNQINEIFAERVRNAYKSLVGKPEVRSQFEDLGLDGEKIEINLMEVF
jgi:hypothetical protein